MTRFILDTGIAGLYLDKKRGVFERAETEVAKGNRVGSPRRCSRSWPSASKAVHDGTTMCYA
jgi:hypothetical protein